MRLLRRASHRLAVWLGLAEDEPDELVPLTELMAEHYRREFLDVDPVDPRALNGLIRLESYVNHPSHRRRP